MAGNALKPPMCKLCHTAHRLSDPHDQAGLKRGAPAPKADDAKLSKGRPSARATR